MVAQCGFAVEAEAALGCEDSTVCYAVCKYCAVSDVHALTLAASVSVSRTVRCGQRNAVHDCCFAVKSARYCAGSVIEAQAG